MALVAGLWLYMMLPTVWMGVRVRSTDQEGAGGRQRGRCGTRYCSAWSIRPTNFLDRPPALPVM
jgi:hypothetical protein